MTLVVALTLLGIPASAATLTIQPAAPTPGATDIYNFIGASHDGANVSDGAPYADGGANDAFTYVAADRSNQGQTFTTGSDTNVYTLRSVWLRHPGYTANADRTWWQMAGGASLTVRVTDPALAGTGGFELATETYTTTGGEGWSTTVQNSTNGTGNWLRFTLDTPMTLQSNKTYGFDITSSSSGTFFEWLGTSNNVHGSGGAYNGNTRGDSGGPDNVLNLLVGDRVFLVDLLPGLQTNTPPAVTNTPYAEARTVAEAFPIDRVRLLDSRFKQNQEFHRTNYLAWLDPDRLLYQFRANAGLPTLGVTHLGGWEGGSGFTAVRGHMAGHYLTAASRMFAATGDTNYLPKIQYLVQELRKCQDALSINEIAAGRVYGYLSGFPSSYFDTLETNPTTAQVPFYTIHKILAGLVDAYRYTTNDLALDVAIGMSDYHQWRVARLSAAQIEAMFRTDNGNSEEWGGMNEALTDLYLLSNARGDSNAVRHLDFAQVFHRDWFINPLYSNLDQLSGLHANTHVPQVTGFARTASVLSTNDVERVRLYTAASNFWHIVTGQHSFALGGNSYSEHFDVAGKEAGSGGSALTFSTAETCNTHNMLKLSRQLFMHDPTAEYADYYEHALYNHILASYETNSGMMTYFVPMRSGDFKTYCLPEGSCWCCTGTGIENPARYNESIYFHKDDVLWVNLFIPSTLNWSERGLTVQLETGFPATNKVKLTMQCPQSTNATVRVRIPSWIAAAPTVKLNSMVQGASPAPGSYYELSRTWADGDTLELTLPMNLRVDHSMDDATQVSLLYGPILLAGDLGTNGMPASDHAAGQWDYSGVPTVAAPSLIGDNPDDPGNWVQSDGGPLAFSAVSAYTGQTSRSVVHLRPFYDIHHTRYAVYWNLIAPADFCLWLGGAASANWTAGGNWDVVPGDQSALQFDLPSGGITTNDLVVDTQINGVQFLAGAGGFSLNGNRIVLQGDVVNQSGSLQSLNLPIRMNGYAWDFDAATADLVLGAEVSGMGGITKTGPHTLSLLADLTAGGSVEVSEGTLQIGDGGTSGSSGNIPMTINAGAFLAFDRNDSFVVDNPISGAGSLMQRGGGILQLSATLEHAGATVVEDGTLQIVSRPVPVLVHRWSFNGALEDTVGTSDAVVVNVGPNNTTLSADDITLAGGARSSSDYVSLGAGLLPKNGSRATIELWATQLGVQNWSRIFDVGASTSENLFMSWSQGTDGNSDRVEWKDAASTTADNSNAPYTVGTEFHIVLMVEPGAGANGSTRVTWYSAPSGNPSLGTARGTFDTANTLATLNDANFWLGRSEYSADSTANARYNEVRLWERTFSASELQQLHELGPDSVGSFAVVTNTGSLASQSDLVLQAGGQVDLNGTHQQVASLSGAQGSVMDLGGGRLTVGSGGDPAATFAGTLAGIGSIQVNGILRLVGDASIAPGVTFTNNGTLDVMTWSGVLPAGFVNLGTVLDRQALAIDSLTLENSNVIVKIHGYLGHGYQLQYRDDLGSGDWQDWGAAVDGSDAVLQLTHPGGAASTGRFYRVIVNP